MTLGLDLEPVVALIEATQTEMEIWIVTLALVLAFGLAMAAIERFRRSPVERLIRRRFGV